MDCDCRTVGRDNMNKGDAKELQQHEPCTSCHKIPKGDNVHSCYVHSCHVCVDHSWAGGFLHGI